MQAFETFLRRLPKGNGCPWQQYYDVLWALWRRGLGDWMANGLEGYTITLGLLQFLEAVKVMSEQAVDAALDARLASMDAGISSVRGRLDTMDGSLAIVAAFAAANQGTASAVSDIQQRMTDMSGSMQTIFDTLTADVEAQTTVANGVTVAFTALQTQLTAAIAAASAAGATPAMLTQLNAIDAGLKQNTATIVTATTTGTPVASEPPAPVVPPTTVDPTTGSPIVVPPPAPPAP